MANNFGGTRSWMGALWWNNTGMSYDEESKTWEYSRTAPNLRICLTFSRNFIRKDSDPEFLTNTQND